MEMTRQRIRPSLQTSTYLSCPHCEGRGFVKSPETLAIEIVRLLNFAMSKEKIKRIELFVSSEVADYLQNTKRSAINHMEQLVDKRVLIHAKPDYKGGSHELVCYNDRGSVVKI